MTAQRWQSRLAYMPQSLFDSVEAEQNAIPLRDYQIDAHKAVWSEYDAGHKRTLLSLATGSGKTVVGSHIANTAIGRGFDKTVMLVHRDELVRQSQDTLKKVMPSLSIGVVKAERDDTHAPFVIASAQTLAVASRLERLARASAGRKLLMLSDECHHDASASRRRAIDTLNPEMLVGLTATPNRADKVGLDAIYDSIAFHLSMLELIAMKRLSPLKGLRIDTEADLDAVHTRMGEFAENELAETVDNDARNNLIVESYRKHAADRLRTVAFCVNVAHANHLIDAFRAAGIRSEGIFGHTPSEERREILAAFHDGDVPVLVNVNVLSEGYDEPAIDCVLWTRPTKSLGLYIQCIGRAARKADGKTDALIIDFVDSSSRHKLVTLPSLAGTEDEVATGEAGDPRKQGELFDLLEFAESKTRLKERAAVAVNLFAASEFIWRTVEDMHVAKVGDGTYLVLWPEGDEFVPARLFPQGAVRPLFDRSLDFETAMGVAELKIPPSNLSKRNAEWRLRDDRPSGKQLAYARYKGIKGASRMSKTELSDAIDLCNITDALKGAHWEEAS